MKFINIILVVNIILICSLTTKAQDEILGRLKDLKPMISTREDVETVLGEGENRGNRVVYHYDKQTVKFTYSDGKCVEKWFAPKDTVVEIIVFFINYRKLSELTKKVNLKKLRAVSAYDMAGEKLYYDDEKGIGYNINTLEKKWSSIIYYPSKKYSSCNCEK